MQFIVRPKSGEREGRRCIVISAHEGHAADKRKELAAKGRVLRIRKSSRGFSLEANLFLALVLDGDWQHSGDSMSNSLEMVAGAGWSGVYDAATLSELAAELGVFFRVNE